MLEFDTVCLDYATFIRYSHMFHVILLNSHKDLNSHGMFPIWNVSKDSPAWLSIGKKKNSGPLKHNKSFH